MGKDQRPRPVTASDVDRRSRRVERYGEAISGLLQIPNRAEEDTHGVGLEELLPTVGRESAFKNA
jgi:hypothetical protein